MRRLLVHLFSLLSLPLALSAQTTGPIPYEFSGGFSRISNSFNGLPRSHQGMNGWDAAVAFPAWHNLRFKIDVSGYSGENLGASEHPIAIMGGGQYERSFHRARFFVEALFGEVSLNPYWGPHGALGGTASFSELLGGGVDTPVSRHFALRVEGGVRFTNFALMESTSNTTPYRVPGLPDRFETLTGGVAWTPWIHSPNYLASHTSEQQRSPVKSDVTYESLNSFGHYHVFAVTWWSYLNVAGAEYDRNSWGRFIGARMDYVAEALPVVILRQPAKTDVWGNPYSTEHETLGGLGFSPMGFRLLWRDGRAWKPYFTVKAGLIAFNQKALSSQASYLNFSLQQSVGMQLKLAPRWDLRAGVSDFHFSDAFLVPSNPGIDEMMANAGLTCRLGRQGAQ